MNNIVFIKRNSALFLAIVLVTGTITLIDPTFMTNVQATSDREKDYDNDEEKDSYIKDRDDESRDNDNDYDDEDKSYGKESRNYDEKDYNNDEDKKSYYKERSYDSKYSSYKSEYSSYGKDKSKDSSSNSVSIKKIKCNNINANLNGIGVNVGLSNNGPVTEPLALAQEVEDNNEDEIESNSIESNEDESYEGKYVKSDSNTNSKIVCINNNNNGPIGEEVEPISKLCEECFAANSTLQTAIIDALSSGIGFVTFDFTEDSENPLVAEVIAAGGQINTLEKFCNEIENAAEFLGVPLSDDIIRENLLFMIETTTGNSAGFESSIEELVECLLEKGLIVDREPFEPIDSLSANGIDNANIQSQCTGSPLCAKIEQ